MRRLAEFIGLSSLCATLIGVLSTSAYPGDLRFDHPFTWNISDQYVDLLHTRTNDLLLVTDDDELILSQQINLRLTAGTIIHHPLGSLTPPEPETANFFPALLYDTFVAGGSSAPTGYISVVGTSSDLGHPHMSPAIATDTILDVSWGAVGGTAGPNGYLSARVTLSDDAKGLLEYAVSFGTASSPIETKTYSFPFCQGVIGITDGSCGPVTVDDKTVEYTAAYPSTIVSETLSLSNGGPFDNVWSLESFDSPNGNPANVDPDTGLFTWDGYGSPAGVYEAVIRFTNDVGTDIGKLSITWHVPEPTAAMLLALGLIVWPNVLRNRR